MTIRPISAVLTFPPGTPIEGIKGRVVRVGKFNQSPPGTSKPWHMQVLELNDGTGAVEVKFWNRVDPATQLPVHLDGYKNKMVYVLATPSAKDGSLCGLITKQDEYRGKLSTIINTTEKAELTEQPPAETQPSLPTQPAPQAPPPPAPQCPPSAKSQTSEQQVAEAARKILDVRKDVFRRVNLWMICAAAVDAMSKELEAQRGMKMSTDQVNATISTIFISSDRDKLHYNLPNVFVDVRPKSKED